jgi:hypothetical protein
MSHPHLSEDRLVDICLSGVAAAPDRTHLQHCEACAERQAVLSETLTEIGGTVRAEADAVFPVDRLARQRARILQRVGQPAPSVVTFPSGQARQAPRPVPGERHWSRWTGVAAAVAASFVVGLLAEHMAHNLPGHRQSVPPQRAVRQADVPTPVALSDDEFLGQIELAAGRVGPAALRPLDALTPHPWDVR